MGLLKMLLSESNLLILDEPTNHLDVSTKELFQKALLEYGGTILIVSHDRAFLDDLVGRVIEIRDGRLYDYPGNYSKIKKKRQKQLENCTEDTAQKNEPAAESKTKEQKRAEAQERNRLYRERKVLQDRLAPVETAIEKDEARKEEISALLCSADTLSDSAKVQALMIELKEVEERLKENYPRWEELAAAIEDIK